MRQRRVMAIMMAGMLCVSTALTGCAKAPGKEQTEAQAMEPAPVTLYLTRYCYFQIPLMIIIFLPAVDSIRPQWREATESLGGNTFQYWTRVAGPILAPRFISAFLLLFASAFSAYATAAALFSQRSILVPLMIQGAMRNEMDPNQQGFAQVLAFAMIVVVAVVMMISHAVEKRAGRWQ